MANNIKIGQLGEEMANQYLLGNKYKIIARNYRETWGEIDIIAKDHDNTLVFVEVKTLKNISPEPVKKDLLFHGSSEASRINLKPEDNLSKSKLEKLKRTADIYANSHPDLINERVGWRIDLIAIEITNQNFENIQLKDLLHYSKINHYKGIVE